MHSQHLNPHHGAAVADQGASVAGQGPAVADQEPTVAGQGPAVANQEPTCVDSTTNAPGTRTAVADPEAEIDDERARFRRILRATPRTVPVEADCATLEESLAALQRILNALDRVMQEQKCVQAALQLDAGEGRVGKIEYCQRFAEASDRIVSAGEAIFKVREVVPLLRHTIEPEGR